MRGIKGKFKGVAKAIAPKMKIMQFSLFMNNENIS